MILVVAYNDPLFNELRGIIPDKFGIPYLSWRKGYLSFEVRQARKFSLPMDAMLAIQDAGFDPESESCPLAIASPLPGWDVMPEEPAPKAAPSNGAPSVNGATIKANDYPGNFPGNSA